MVSITAHCIVKNEENYIWYAIKSVIDFVDKIIVYDTGSRDKTVKIIQELVKEYPKKIIFEEKGTCDKKRHTELRQEMLERTETDWFMILDGDEVWSDSGMKELSIIINNNHEVGCIVAPFHLCVGDIFHETKKKGNFNILGKIDFHSPRVFKVFNGIKWSGKYEEDTLLDKQNRVYFNEDNTVFLSSKYWHLTHLIRSSKDQDDYSSGGIRKQKIRDSYFLIGRRINEDVPEVFRGEINRLSLLGSLVSFFKMLSNRLLQLRVQFSKYFLIGISALFFDIISLFVFKQYFGLSPVIAVIINQILILNYVFLLNKYWSFGTRGMGHHQIVKFYSLAGFNYLFSVAWMWFLTEQLYFNYLLARIINIALAVSWNFVLYKIWVYKK